MDKKEYLSELDRYLVTLPPAEKNMHLERYGVILSELENSGQNIIEKLGTPKELATSIVFSDADNVGRGGNYNRNYNRSYDRKADKRERKALKREEKRRKRRGGGIIWKLLGCFVLLILGVALLGNIIFKGKVVYWDNVNHRVTITDIDEGISYDRVELGDVTDIDIDAVYADVYLIPSDTYAVEYRLTGEGKVPYSDKNNKLTINDNGISGLRFSFDWFSDHDTKRDDYIKIYYPADAGFNDININLDMGSLEMEALIASNLYVDLDMGGMDIKDCTIEDGDCNLDMGGITLDNCVFGTLAVDLDMGAMDGADVCILDELTAELDMGSADVQLLEELPSGEDISYGYDLDTEMGSVDIEGDSKGKEYDKSGDADIEIDCDMGSINITH